MNNNIDINKVQIFLDLQGEPVNKGGMCLSTSHGHYAYVETGVDAFVYRLFKEMSILGGATDVHMTRDFNYFSQFELDCADKGFFKSRTFKKICEHHNIKFVIIDNGEDDAHISRAFWNQMMWR